MPSTGTGTASKALFATRAGAVPAPLASLRDLQAAPGLSCLIWFNHVAGTHACLVTEAALNSR